MFTVELSDLAEADIQRAFTWWRDNRSSEQAHRWYRAVKRALGTLREIADRCAPAMEANLHPLGLRQLHFGAGRRPTHRVIFVVDGSRVVVYRIRHAAQATLESDDLP